MNTHERLTIAPGNTSFLGQADNAGQDAFRRAVLSVRSGEGAFIVSETGTPSDDNGVKIKSGNIIYLRRANQIRFFQAYAAGPDELVIDVTYGGEDLAIESGLGEFDESGHLIIAGYDSAQDAITIINRAPYNDIKYMDGENDPLLNAATASGFSPPRYVHGLTKLLFMIDASGGASGEITVYTNTDGGSKWYPTGATTTISADGQAILELDGAYEFVCVYLDYTSGAFTVTDKFGR